MSRIIYQDIIKEVTAAGGTGTVNSDRMNGELMFLWVKATSAANDFDFQIIDPAGRTIRHYTDEVAYIRDSEILPVKGIHSLKILNASINELFDIMIRVREIT